MINSTLGLSLLDTSHTPPILTIKNVSGHRQIFPGSKVIPKENNYCRTMWVLPVSWGSSQCHYFQVFPFGQVRFLRKGSSSRLLGGQRFDCQWSGGWLEKKPEICTIKPFQGEWIREKVLSQKKCCQREQGTKYISTSLPLSSLEMLEIEGPEGWPACGRRYS